MFRKFVKISEISKCLDISGKCVSIKSGVEEKITVNFGNSQFFSESVGSFAIGSYEKSVIYWK